MDKLKLLLQDGTETAITGVAGGALIKTLYGTSYPNFQIPVLNYLNDVEAFWIYGAVFASANALSNLTGDFLLPWVSGQKYISNVSKFTQPMTTGLLAVGLLAVLNMSVPSMMESAQMFALGAGSNVIGQWLAQRIVGDNWSKQLGQINTNPLPQVNTVQPNVSNPTPSTYSAPIDFGGNDFFGLMGNNSGFSLF